MDIASVFIVFMYLFWIYVVFTEQQGSKYLASQLKGIEVYEPIAHFIYNFS